MYSFGDMVCILVLEIHKTVKIPCFAHFYLKHSVGYAYIDHRSWWVGVCIGACVCVCKKLAMNDFLMFELKNAGHVTTPIHCSTYEFSIWVPLLGFYLKDLSKLWAVSSSLLPMTWSHCLPYSNALLPQQVCRKNVLGFLLRRTHLALASQSDFATSRLLTLLFQATFEQLKT